jgi:hypothetical protein
MSKKKLKANLQYYAFTVVDDELDNNIFSVLSEEDGWWGETEEDAVKELLDNQEVEKDTKIEVYKLGAELVGKFKFRLTKTE